MTSGFAHYRGNCQRKMWRGIKIEFFPKRGICACYGKIQPTGIQRKSIEPLFSLMQHWLKNQRKRENTFDFRWFLNMKSTRNGTDSHPCPARLSRCCQYQAETWNCGCCQVICPSSRLETSSWWRWRVLRPCSLSCCPVSRLYSIQSAVGQGW